MKQTLNKQSTGFTQIKNKVLNDKELSWKAKGIYCYIYSKPNDWQFSAKRIALDSKNNFKTVLTGLKELENTGYLERIKLTTGRVQYYINYDKKPLFKPKSQKGNETKRQLDKKGTISNKEFNSNKEVNKGNTFFQKDIAVSSTSNRNKIKQLQTMIDNKGAGFKKTEKKPKGRTARAFTNEARKRAGKEPIPKDQLLQLLTYWQKYNPALNPLNKTEREPAKKLLEMWGDDWREKLDLVFKVQEYKYCKVIATTPREVFKNYTALKLTLKKIKNENNRKNN